MKKVIMLALLVSFSACKDNKGEKEREDSAKKSALESPEISESFSRGAKIYNNFCATCHLSSGEGIPNAFPPLNNSNWLTEKRTATIRAVKYGLKGPIEVNGVEYNSLMPAMGLTDEEVKDVLNYIFYAWENNVEKPATLEEVKAVTE